MDIETATSNAIENCKKNIMENTQKKYMEYVTAINNAISTSCVQEIKFKITTNLQMITMLQEYFNKFNVAITIDQQTQTTGFSFNFGNNTNKQIVQEFALLVCVPLK